MSSAVRQKNEDNGPVMRVQLFISNRCRETSHKKTAARPREFMAALGFFLGEGTYRVVQSMRRQRFHKFHILIFKSSSFLFATKSGAPLHEFHFNFQKFRI